MTEPTAIRADDLIPTSASPSSGDRVPNGAASHGNHRTVSERRTLDASPFATLVFDLDLRMLDSNAAHAVMSGVATADLQGRLIFDVFPKNPRQDGPDTEEIIRASVARMVERGGPDETPMQRHDLPRPDGAFEHRYWRMIHSPIRNDDGTIVAVRQDAWDVTATVEASQRAESVRRSAQTAAGVAFWEADLGRGTFKPSPELEAMFGYAPGESEGQIARLLERIHPDDLPAVTDAIESLRAGPNRVPVQLEYRTLALGNEAVADETTAARGGGASDDAPPRERHLIVRSEMLPAGEERILVGTAFDVTPLKRHERELAAALAQKETLLGEVNHRVKNSLQLVASILALGARGEADATARERLQEAADRVRAVASVHMALYHTDDVRSVPFAEHLRGFCAQLAAGAGLAERGIELVVDADEVDLATERAVALSVIVNELVTNSFKYAFPDTTASGTARVVVSLRRHEGSDEDGGRTLVLAVADNGGAVRGDVPAPSAAATSGPPETNIAGPSGTGLGTRLVTALARQVGARIEQSHDGGWTTRIVFDA